MVKMPLGMEVGVNTGHIVLDGDPARPKGHSPQFSAHVCCGRTAGWIKMPLGIKVGLGLGDIVLGEDATWYGGRPRPMPHCVRCGPSFPFPLKRAITAPPHFSAHVCCSQTAGWIRIPTTEVSLGPGNVVLITWGPSSPPSERGTASPLFGHTVAYICENIGTQNVADEMKRTTVQGGSLATAQYCCCRKYLSSGAASFGSSMKRCS